MYFKNISVQLTISISLLFTTSTVSAETCIEELAVMVQQCHHQYAKLEFDAGSYLLKTAIRKFSAPDGTNRTITLAGMVHLGDASYYEKVRRSVFNTSDKVIYEHMGAPIDFTELVYSTAACSGLDTFHDFGFTRAKALNLTSQGVLFPYMVSSKFVHADEENIGLKENPASKVFAQYIQQCLNFKQSMWGYIPPFLRPLWKVLFGGWASIEEYNHDQLEEQKQKNVSTCDVGIGLVLAPGSKFWDSLSKQLRFDQRNDIALRKLDEVLSNNGSTKDIAIVYGVHHQPVFEAYIVKQLNFKHISTEWVDAFILRD